MSLRKGLTLGLLVVLLGTSLSGMLAANVVASSRAGRYVTATDGDDVKPWPDCSGITLTTIVAGSGTVTGSSAAELVVGSTVVDTMDGKAGNDCIVGGGGNDSLTGGLGTDVCIGGPGTDTFNGNCETQIQ